MLCLSLWQPWASLLVGGVKRVETRGWPIKHRGPLLIHAAKRWDGSTARLCLGEPFRPALRACGIDIPPAGHEFTHADVSAMKAGWNLPFGKVVGRVNVVECYRTGDVDFDAAGLDCTPRDPVWQYAAGKLRCWHEEKPFGDYSPGRFAFLCSDPVAFAEPIPFRGAQGLFNVGADLLPGA